MRGVEWGGSTARGSQVQQVTHTVHGILKNGVTDSAKIERLLAKFGEAPGPNPSTTLRYSAPAAMLPAAEDQTWMGRANPARPKGKRPVQNLPGALHPLWESACALKVRMGLTPWGGHRRTVSGGRGNRTSWWWMGLLGRNLEPASLHAKGSWISVGLARGAW